MIKFVLNETYGMNILRFVIKEQEVTFELF
jgi:hypothetical protein